MPRLIILLVLITVGFYVARRLVTKFGGVKPTRKQGWLLAGGVALLLLALTGHLAALPALIGVLLTFLLRNLPIVLRYAPQLQQFWRQFNNAKQQQYRADSPPPMSGKMTVAEAHKILGLTPPAAKQDIIVAHKKLMQKMHPDRGGSAYLASQINQAKACLLKD